MPSRTRSTPTYPRKRHRRDDDGWHSYDEDEDRNNDVEEWEAQADGTFEKLVKPVPAEAASDQLVNLQLGRDTDSVMDEEEDEEEEDEPVAEEEPEQGEGEEPGADEEEGEAAEHSEGAVPQKDTDARQRERPYKRPKMDEEEDL